MVIIMDTVRKLVIDHFKKSLKTKEIYNRVASLGVSLRFVQRAIKRFKETGTFAIKPKKGRKRSVRVAANIKIIRERLRRNPAQSLNKMAKEVKISSTTARRIVHTDLKMKTYKKQKVHGLTVVQRKARVAKCKNLLAWHADDEIIFSDEKMFLLKDTHNHQNDRVYGVRLKDIPVDKLAVQQFQNTSAVMVWGAICKRGKLPLLFIERGVKINKEYYLDHVLKGHLQEHAKKLYGEDYYCFQQDSAPSHKAKLTQKWCEENLPDFISAEEWPSSSPDLNPLDFSIWGYMLGRIGSTAGMNLESFKSRLLKIWDEIPIEVVRASCSNFFTRMKKVIAARGERFELRT